jgi:hypothetical protein
MINASNYTYISSGTTTVIGPIAGTTSLPTTGRRIALVGIGINKTLTGTVTVKSGATTIGVLAIGTLAGIYWDTVFGIEIADLQIITSAADDVTVFWNNL